MSGREHGSLRSRVLTWLEEGACDRSGLSKNARLIQFQLSRFMSPEGDSAYPAVATLAARAGCSESTTRGALRELEERGWLEVEKHVGRGNTNVYTAQIPSQNPQTAGVSDPGDGAAVTGLGGAERPSATPPAAAASTSSPDPENQRGTVGFESGKSTENGAENPQKSAVKAPGSGPDLPMNGPGPTTTSSSSPVDRALAARALDDDDPRLALSYLGLGAEQFSRAITALRADPERGRACIRAALAHGDSPGAYLDSIIRNGSHPTVATAETKPTLLERRRQTVAQLVRDLREDGVDEARYRVDVEWDDLTTVERGELHELVDELASNLLPTPIAATAPSAREVA